MYGDGLGQIPNPVDWIRGKVQEFYLLPAKLGADKARARRMLDILRARGDLQGAGQVEGALQDLSQTQIRWNETAGKLAQLTEALGAAGVQLGVVPIAVLVLAGTVAALMAGVFFSYAKQRDLLDAIESGTLTPEEAARLRPSPFGLELGGLGTLALIGGAVLILPKLLGRRRGG